MTRLAEATSIWPHHHHHHHHPPSSNVKMNSNGSGQNSAGSPATSSSSSSSPASSTATPLVSSTSPTPSIDSLNGVNGEGGSSCSGSSNGECSVEFGAGGPGNCGVIGGGAASGNSSGRNAGAAIVANGGVNFQYNQIHSSSSSGLGSSPQLRNCVGSLIGDLGVPGLLESSPNADFCTSCKNRDTLNLVAKCKKCSGFLCTNCFPGHQCLHGFDTGLGLTDLTRTTSAASSTSSTTSSASQQQQQEASVSDLEAVQHFAFESKTKANELKASLKGLDSTNSRLQSHFVKAQNEINETFQYFTNLLEERKAEVMKDLETAFSNKQVTLQVYQQKALDSAEKMIQSTELFDRLVKRASSGEVVLYKRPIEQRFAAISAIYNEALVASANFSNAEQITDFDYVQPSYTTIQAALRSNFGYIRSRNESTGSSSSSGGSVGTGKQPPISRPVSSSSSSGTSSNTNNLNLNNNSLGLSPLLNQGLNGLMGGIIGQSGSSQTSSFNGLLDSGRALQKTQQTPPAASGFNLSSSSSQSDCSGIIDNSLLAKRFTRGSLGPIVPANGLLGDLNGHSSHHNPLMNSHSNPYEKWSNGSDVHQVAAAVAAQAQQHLSSLSNGHLQNNHQSLGLTSSLIGIGGGNSESSLLELSSKLLSTPIFPPKSQIKRQKMIYHCKFGEFGVLEGQFTEPSGVAVNAQNDIIVADTNNHRIQIFDKEGRFKFQFGECGKRDGQLLYPNRVAVVRQSGDIIVTERSPTHQVQIYNQYGQFVRKFGANILQHPRGVCVDNKGRIIVVECKVMRVIIFDQMGNVLNKFGCSKHLEFPNGVVVNDRQEIFISDNRAHCVKVFNYEGTFLRQIGGEGITNYPIGVGINAAGEVAIADNHNNFNLTVFSQEGQLLSALESKVKHAQCFDVALMDDGSVVLASKDYRLYIYRYVQVPQIGM